MLIPELQEFNRLFAQMDILQQKLIQIWSRDNLICENVLGSGSPTPPGVEFWRAKIRFYPAGHRKTAQHQKLIKIWSRDILICKRLLGILTPTPPGVEFWKTKIRFYPAGHRKTRQQQNNRKCRLITLRGKIKGLKKSEDSRLTV